ncbi:MAG: hypothetical protein HDQ87_05275 [Clostridia bacterium]|nr:hypothetical protein [Clostridia bacterium]
MSDTIVMYSIAYWKTASKSHSLAAGLASATSRIKLNDMQLLPMLCINNPKQALQAAIKAGAVKLTAVPLEEVNEGQKLSEVGNFRLCQFTC